MASDALFSELCDLLRQAGIEVRTERFERPSARGGGLCWTGGTPLVLLDSAASPAERTRTLLEVVEELGLEKLGIAGAELSPSLLATLNKRGRMPWPKRHEAPRLARARKRDPDEP